MRVMTVVGARPQFIKVAPVGRALAAAGHSEFIVHTGQHYDHGMSGAFFEELGIPEPDVDLGVGSAPRDEQLAAMQEGIAAALAAYGADVVLVYGDTNSTLAGARAAAAACIRLAHVEAGLRSFADMPEELNRVETDGLSDLLFCPSEVAADHLSAEGIVDGVHIVGDVMRDSLELALGRVADPRHARDPRNPGRLEPLEPGSYVFATIHRAANTDDATRLRSILEGLASGGLPVFLPLHPRTSAAMERDGIAAPEGVSVIEPVGYVASVGLARSAAVVATDSGGLQKEAYWLGVPCVTLRDETEWIETLATGWNVLAGADAAAIGAAIRSASSARPTNHPPLYGEPGAATRIVALL